MSALILHHYEFSPFAEKVRLAFGLKALDWHAVDVPSQTPKPDLAPLTAGYVRVPVLQIGADVFCDTALILREIERRHPEPTLYPGGQRGLCSALGWWWERATFMTAASLTTSIMGDALPVEFLEERRRTMRHDFSKDASLATLPLNRQRVTAHMGWLADMLRDGRPFLLGPSVSAADLACYHTMWFTRQNGGETAEEMLPFGPLIAWMDRVAALGHGTRREMSAADALEVARAAKPEPVRLPPDGDPSDYRAGEQVVVRTDDTAHDAMSGTLVAADSEELIIRHENPRVGTVHVHLPRVGYDVLRA